MSYRLLVNPEFRGTTSILINNAVPADGTILYVANGVICAVTPPVDGTNKALCITDNIPSWNTVTVGNSDPIVGLRAPVMNSSGYVANLWQYSGQPSGGLTISMINTYPVTATSYTVLDSFMTNFVSNVKFTL
jgi:hypothetical protein